MRFRSCTQNPHLRRLLAWIFALGGVSSAFSAEELHPQDGPHVDIRIFIDAEAVVLQLEMNLVFLDYLVDFPREEPARISSVEWPDLKPTLLEFFEQSHPVRIDDQRVLPELEELQINDPDLALLPLFPISGEQGLRKIRFRLVYPTSSMPSKVEISWTTFPPDILTDLVDPPPLDLAAELDAEGVRAPLLFTVDEPGLTWRALGGSIDARLLEVPESVIEPGSQVPVLAIMFFVAGGVVLIVGILVSRLSDSPVPVVAAVGIEGVLLISGVGLLFSDFGRVTMGGGPRLPDVVEAEAIFRPLHANVYRAFDYVEESDIYDALDRSVDGPFLETLYRTIFRGLVMQEEGGAVARVTEVRPLEIEVGDIVMEEGEDGLERPAFTVSCRWQVDGVVSHWGHSHERTNEYFADWDVVEGPDGWQLTGAEIREQDRLEEEGHVEVGEEFDV
ncbi:MAG: hypothetical protein CBB69_009950 [Phycisphaera sp. TMED9]|nr:MAG: hypothetical protein CBB69_009950 [Phycisphaera sp. TMED9]